MNALIFLPINKWGYLQALYAESDQISTTLQQFYTYKYENQASAYHIIQLENLP